MRKLLVALFLSLLITGNCFADWANTADKKWRAAVATFADLPTVGNLPGDVRYVVADADLWGWNGAAWVLVGSPLDIYAKVSATDTTPSYINTKLTVTTPLSKVIVAPGGVESLNLTVGYDDSTIKVSGGNLYVPDDGITEPKLDIVNAPVGGYNLQWSAGDGKMKWVAETAYAPLASTYVTISLDGTLPNERALTAGTGVTLTDGGAGASATIAIGQAVAVGNSPLFTALTLGYNGASSGSLVLFSEQGTPDYTCTINPSTAMTSSAVFYLPVDEPAANDRALIVSTGGVMSYNDQALLISSAATFTSVDTGQGANELYDMDQNVLTTSGVTFADVSIMGTTGGFKRKYSEATATLSGANTTIQVNVPTGAKLLGVQLRVDVLITSGTGGTSWAADFSGGSSTAICSGQAFAKDTRFNLMMVGTEIIGSEADILIDCDGANTFSGGVVRAIVYYEEITAMGVVP